MRKKFRQCRQKRGEIFQEHRRIEIKHISMFDENANKILASSEKPRKEYWRILLQRKANKILPYLCYEFT